jgi:hypothetical protein
MFRGHGIFSKHRDAQFIHLGGETVHFDSLELGLLRNRDEGRKLDAGDELWIGEEGICGWGGGDCGCLYRPGVVVFAGGFCLKGEERLFRSGDMYEERLQARGRMQRDSGGFK